MCSENKCLDHTTKIDIDLSMESIMDHADYAHSNTGLSQSLEVMHVFFVY